MRFARSRPDRVMPIEITPMIDVVFLLIIFFMTTARFAQITRADLELPKEAGEQQETGEEAGLVINVLADGSVMVGEATVSLAELETIVLEALREQLIRPTNAEGVPGHVSDVNYTIDRTNNVATTETLLSDVSIRPLGYAKFITTTLGYALSV